MLRNLVSRPNLLLRFTLISFFLTIGIAIALTLGIQQRLENDALQQEANSAADQVALILNPNLWAHDLTGPLTPSRFSALDSLIRKEILREHIVHVKIYSRDGTVLYSDEANLVGHKFPIDDELAKALTGQVGMDISDLSKPENITERGQYSRLLEVYIPLHPTDAPGQVLGAYEIYHDLTVVQPRIDDMRNYVTLSVGIGFLVLFFSLFFLVRNASRELFLRNAENSRLYKKSKEQVLDLQRAEEKSQRRYQRLAALRAIDEAISANLDLILTLRIFLDQATTQLQVDAADILLLNQFTNLLTFAGGSGFNTDIIKASKLHIGEGYAGRVVQERRMLKIPDLTVESGFTSNSLFTQEGFRVYYALPLITKGKVRGVLEVFHRSPLNPDKDWLEFLEGLAEQASIAIGDAELFDNLQRSNMQLIRAYDATIAGWSHALDLRDKETEGHTQRVTEMTLNLAQAFGVGSEDQVNIHRGALLHDIGKMGIPDHILLKPGPLTELEWQVMRKHPLYAYDMLSSIEYLRPAVDIPYCHHEKWDGTGYPRGLKGEQIPFAARLFAVVDVWDALSSDRPYRLSWPEEKVRQYILEQRGIHFEPVVVDMFINILDQVKSLNFMTVS